MPQQGTLRISPHVHTRASFDGHASFEAILRMAKKMCLDAICITDHDTVTGAFQFRDWMRNRSHIEVILGEEITCTDGTHIIGLGLTRPITAATPIEVVKAICDQGALVYFPHPTRKDGIFSSTEAKQCLPLGHFIEVFNAKVPLQFNQSPQTSSSEFKIDHLAALSGADAHYASDLQKALSVIPRTGTALESLRTYAVKGDAQLWGYHQATWADSLVKKYDQKKKALGLPRWLRNTAKHVYPALKDAAQQFGNFKLDPVNSVYSRRSTETCNS